MLSVYISNIALPRGTSLQGSKKNSQGIKTQNDITSLSSISYIAFTSCILDHIITNAQLTHLEKLYYLLADSLAIINYRSGKKRIIALACRQWAGKLNCSRSKIFELQKSLKEKGYFIIIKDKNKCGQNKRNIIIPTLPQKIFDNICSDAKNRVGEHLPFDAFSEDKRAYLDRTKLYLKFNYQLIKDIAVNVNLKPFQKVLWLDLYFKALISKKGKATDSIGIGGYFSTISYQELALRHSCTNKHIAKSVKILQDYGLLTAKRFFIKKDLDSTGSERQDKSLWKITVNIPEFYDAVKAKNLKKTIAAVPKLEALNLDPDFSKSRPLLNKDFKEENNNRSSTNENLLKSDTNSSVAEQSNFSKKDLDLKKSDNETKPVPSFAKARGLKDFYPLNESDCLELQRSSGRKFDLNAMNEILRNMASRLRDKVFKTKKAFMNYMTKAFSYEIRDEVKINNINFKITCKGSEEERVAIRERFLSEIERSLYVSPEWHFKKRLTSVLSPDKAYEVLKAYMGVRVEEGTLTLELNKHVDLSNTEKEIILSHAKSTHNGVLTEGGEKLLVSELKVFILERRATSSNNNYEPILEKNIWGEVRRGLIDIFGKYTDKHWFSKINAEVDEHSKLLKLKASNNFVLDWIKQHYSHRIETIASQFGFNTSFYNQQGSQHTS